MVEPLPGHEYYRGMLAIPYMRWSPGSGWSVVSIRFRCLENECDHSSHPGGKYATVAGDTPRLYNTISLLTAEDTVAICEGEIDTITASISDIPAVGVAGTQTWKRHFAEPFRGYETVYILADGDTAGREFAETLADKLSNAKILPCSQGEDVNSEVLKYGKKILLDRIDG
ncbi:toprim domain-containing protein [Actinopolyspora erythraea]|uniref:toprim domain-containing protein n=1 Tax=Actinopolyspora erythraea TaxID=414996 RepID=UPI0018E0331A|nr:toprim domain-containing protein [Actinopolyspora erythraea]